MVDIERVIQMHKTFFGSVGGLALLALVTGYIIGATAADVGRATSEAEKILRDEVR